MQRRFFSLVAPLPLVGLCGCLFLQPPAPAPPTGPVSARSVDATTRNNACALLDDLLGDEKNLGKILIVKRESPELKRLVKDISETASRGAKLLQSLAKNDPSLRLEDLGLPPGEQAARKAIARRTRYELLHASGVEFERRLLLTQVQALNYARHLAAVVAENEPQPAHAREFADLSAQFQHLHEQATTMLATKHP